MDRNSSISLFLYRRRKRRRKRLHWAQPVIQKGKNSVPLKHYLMNYEMTKKSFQLFSNVRFIFRRVASPIEGESSAL